jgi:1,4-alpha-glucan branching enzyme
MKHNKNPDNSRNVAPSLVPVHFEFIHPTARTVSVAGTFNDWHPTSEAMHPSGNGHWRKDTALTPGTHEYCLIVDGCWMADPLVKETVPNPFGGRNSLLQITSSPEATHLADAENLPLKNRKKPKLEPYEQRNKSNQQ